MILLATDRRAAGSATGDEFTHSSRRPAWRGLLLASVLLGLLTFIRANAASIPDPDYLIDIWEVEQGLPQHTTTAMVQAPDGYLWFGTFGGLVRYDGVKFIVFDERNTPSLPSGSIVNLHHDQAGRLWVSTREGLVVSQGRNWTRFDKVPGWTGDLVRTFAEKDRLMCVTSFNGKVFTNRNDSLIEMPRPPGREGQGYLSHIDRQGRLWLAQNGFFGWWDATGEQWIVSPMAPTITNSFKGISTGRDGSLLTYSQNEFLRMDGDQVLTRFPMAEEVPYCWQICETSDGRLWIPTVEQGLYSLDPRSGAARRYTTADGLAYDSMRFAFEDRERNVWIGTSGGGLMRFKRRTFHSFTTDLLNRNVKAVAEESPGKVLIGTFGGPLLQVESNRVSPSTFTIKGDDGGSLFIQCLMVDHHRQTWIGTYGRGMQVYKDGIGRRVGSEATGGSSVFALFEDSKGRIWIGWEDVLAMFDGTDFHRIAQGNLRLAPIRFFAEDRQNDILWALTTRGLFQLQSNVWREVTWPTGQPITRGNCLFVASSGNLWLGISGRGLARRSPDGRWTEVTEAHGLPKCNVSSFQEDHLGYWWLGSDRGVIRAARSDLAAVAEGRLAKLPCQVFTTSDGLPNLECANGFQSVSARDDQGRIWFATSKGLAVVDPDQLYLSTNLPPVVIDSVAFVDRGGKRHQIVLTQGNLTVTVPPGSRELEVHYTALSFTAPEKLRFAYRLEDEGADWVDAGDRRALYFHTLKPGPLRLQVRAANEDGIWGGNSASLGVNIQPYFWQTAAFRVLTIAALLAAGCLTVWRIAHNKLRRQIERLNQERALERERARLAAVMDGTSDFVGFCDPAGNITYVNAAGRRMIGWNESENIAGRRIADCHLPAVTRQVVEEALPIALRDGIWSGETAFLHKDGREIPTSQVIIAHKGSDGALQFFSTIARDITERKRAATEIRQLNSDLERRVEERTAELQAITKDLEAFSYSVAHDLRAPLQNISGYAGLFRTSAGTLNPVSTRYLDVIGTQVKRMATLIEDLLSFARVTRAELRRVPVNLDEMIRQTREAMALEQQKRNINWTIDPLPSVLADRGLLRQVVANLVSNAVKYSRDRDPAVIHIGALPQTNGEVVVFVRDNGAGFDMKHAAKLFEAFHRLHSAEEFEGNGIGLANVHRIIQRHGGRVWAEAELNKGATFYFSLPT